MPARSSASPSRCRCTHLGAVLAAMTSAQLGAGCTRPPIASGVAAAGIELPSPDCRELSVIHARLYADPSSEVRRNATIRMRDGVIVEISDGRTAGRDPDGRCTLDVRGRPVTAGFWNSHVHLTDPALRDDARVGELLDAMLLSRGFTSVVDLGSDPRIANRLRSAIEGGEVPGPRLILAGGSFVYRGGTPAYLPKGLLPELGEAGEAGPAVNAALDAGADGIKIFSGSFQTAEYTIYLPPDIIAAVTEAAHARGAFVASHPTDRVGLVNAVENGVDVVAHTAPPAGELQPDLLARMRERNVALIPTLKIWRWDLERLGLPARVVDSYVASGVAQLGQYHAAGGEILFGTDVGYMTDFDPAEEYMLMERAGLDFRDILRSLTVNPSRRFVGGQAFVVTGASRSTPADPGTAGTVTAGEAADLVVLDRDPAVDVRAFASPLVVLRAGRVVSSGS